MLPRLSFPLLAGLVLLLGQAAVAQPSNQVTLTLTGLLFIQNHAAEGIDVFVPDVPEHELRMYYNCTGDSWTPDGYPACPEVELPIDCSGIEPASECLAQVLGLVGGRASADVESPLRPEDLRDTPPSPCALDSAAAPTWELPAASLTAEAGCYHYNTEAGRHKLAEIYTYTARSSGVDAARLNLTEPSSDFLLTYSDLQQPPAGQHIVLGHMVGFAEDLLTCAPDRIRIPISTEVVPACSVTEGSGPVKCPPVYDD